MLQLLFPSSSLSNHKQLKAGNRRAGKEGDTVSQSREQNQRQSSHSWDLENLTDLFSIKPVLVSKCAVMNIVRNQSQCSQSYLLTKRVIHAQLITSKHVSPQVTTVFTILLGFMKNTQELCGLNRPSHFWHGHPHRGSIISLSISPFLFPKFPFPLFFLHCLWYL